MNKKKTIAVLGGSFDPIHAGHLQIARSALHMGMDEVWLMVTKDTPLKDRTLSSAADRTAMIERAIAPYRHIHCCRLELEREGKSYTIDTVRELKRSCLPGKRWMHCWKKCRSSCFPAPVPM